MEERTRFNATIPRWLREAIDPDCADVGAGPKKLGGDQSVVMTALLLYLRLPKADRVRLARTISARDESSVLGDLESHWLTRAIDAVSALGEDSVATLEAALKVADARQSEAGRSGRRGSAAGRQSGSPRKSTRRQGA